MHNIKFWIYPEFLFFNLKIKFWIDPEFSITRHNIKFWIHPEFIFINLKIKFWMDPDPFFGVHILGSSLTTK